MTAKQKANQARFKKVVAEASKLRKKDSKLTQAQAVKKAWAMFTGKKVGSTHKDTKSHNVNIRVVSGLPFEGRYLGVKLRAVLSSSNRIVIYAGNSVIYYYKGDNQKIIAEKIAKEIIKEAGTENKTEKQILSAMKNFVATLKEEFPAGSVTKKSAMKKTATKKKAATKKSATKKTTTTKKKKQTGSSNKIFDLRKQALKPGKRTTSWGTTYYESRANRSDKGKLLGIKGGVMGSPSYTDPDMAREIQLYADSDSKLYFSRKLPILKNLQKKYKKGTFDVEKSAKLWRYFIDDALQRYNKEFGSRGDKWFELMKPSDRQLLAMEYAVDTLNEFEMGNFIVD
jgi:hypothetical protein